MNVNNNEISLDSAMIDVHVPVAQGIERLPSKQRVAGSNPAWGATSAHPAKVWVSPALSCEPQGW